MLKRTNKLFLILFFTVWVTAFIVRFFFAKGEILTTISNLRTDQFNLFFLIGTTLAEELVYITFAVVFLFIRYRCSIAIGLTGLSVTIIAGVLKWLFAFSRPYSYYHKIGMPDLYLTIDGVEPYMGLNSFPSGHAMAGFALMSLLSIYIRNVWITLPLFATALIVAASRVYLGHHFLEDVLFGSLLGVGLSYLVYFLTEKWDIPMLDQSFLSSRKVNLNA